VAPNTTATVGVEQRRIDDLRVGRASPRASAMRPSMKPCRSRRRVVLGVLGQVAVRDARLGDLPR
jgi:hypothetical protein